MQSRIKQEKPTKEEWDLMMNAIKQQKEKPVVIPEQFAEYMIDHFTNCLPPIVWSDDYVLCSEPYDEDSEGKERYIGFYQSNHIYYGVITTIVKFNALKNESL